MTREYPVSRGRKKGGGNFGVGGPNVNNRTNTGFFRCNGYTDPKSAVTERSHPVRVNGEICMGGHYDVNGIPVKGPIKINNVRVLDGHGGLIDKLQFIALAPNIKNDDEWFNQKKALLVDEYIEKQEESRIKKGYGFVYEHSFFDLK